MQTTITPKYINEPKPGKKNWSIKDEAGVYYSVAPDMAAGMKVGQPVTFDYKVNNFQGKDFNIIERVYGSSAPAPQQAPAPAGHNSNGQRGGNGDPRSEDIFVAGVVNNAIAHQSHPVDGASLATLVKSARWAYRHGEPAGDEFGDAVPF